MPSNWRDAGLVLLAPVINDWTRLAAAFRDASVAAEARAVAALALRTRWRGAHGVRWETARGAGEPAGAVS